jgi:hypothetical protein
MTVDEPGADHHRILSRQIKRGGPGACAVGRNTLSGGSLALKADPTHRPSGKNLYTSRTDDRPPSRCGAPPGHLSKLLSGHLSL